MNFSTLQDVTDLAMRQTDQSTIQLSVLIGFYVFDL
jgi:hypothetical protein